MNNREILKSNIVHWIEPEKEIDTEKRQRPKWVEKSFEVKGINGDEELFITAHGCYEAYIKHQGIQGKGQWRHHDLPPADLAGASAAFSHGKSGKAHGYCAGRFCG